jgi:hypothetical protein
MAKQLISELTQEKLNSIIQESNKDMKNLINQSEFEGMIKGEDRSGWEGIINLGLYPLGDGNHERYIIHTSLEGEARKCRNVEWDKIRNYMIATRLLNSIPSHMQSIKVPTIIGHKIVMDNSERNISVREIYATYEPRTLAFADIVPDAQNYAYHLGTNIARFLYTGMINVRRHLRPDFTNKDKPLLRMIDLDDHDPHTFKWVCNDEFEKNSGSYNSLIDREKLFFQNASTYFLEELIPEEIKQDKANINKLKKAYYGGFISEILTFKNASVSNQFKLDDILI